MENALCEAVFTLQSPVYQYTLISGTIYIIVCYTVCIHRSFHAGRIIVRLTGFFVQKVAHAYATLVGRGRKWGGTCT